MVLAKYSIVCKLSSILVPKPKLYNRKILHAGCFVRSELNIAPKQKNNTKSMGRKCPTANPMICSCINADSKNTINLAKILFLGII